MKCLAFRDIFFVIPIVSGDIVSGLTVDVGIIVLKKYNSPTFKLYTVPYVWHKERKKQCVMS